MKVLICDYTGNSAKWIDEFVIKENLEVVGTITSATDEKLADKNSWEYILVFEDGMQKFFLSTIAQPAKIPEKRIIFALDWNNWAIHPTAAQTLLNQMGGYSSTSFALQYCTSFKFVYCCQYKGRFPFYSLRRKSWGSVK